jgi:hypothetical protein
MCSHLVTSSVDLSIPYNGLRKKADFQATNIHDAGWMFGPRGETPGGQNDRAGMATPLCGFPISNPYNVLAEAGT